ncbi:MAG TPA: hypothetical protein VHN12_11265 [Geobacteraceae bacterium]|nr:hypothetical protein [Geobacteraceae bacterium]
MIDVYDHLEIRCPRLGGQVTFAYCRVEGGELPCMRIVACWQSCLPIAEYLRDRLAPDQLERFTEQKPKERIVTLVEMIEAAKKENRV